MRTPVHRELDAWGWYVERLACIAAANRYGGDDITEREYQQMREHYMWMWSLHGVA